MSRLLSKGYIASLAPQGAPNIDILVTSADGSMLKSIQVKTTRTSHSWRFAEKHEKIDNANLFYCLVHLDSPEKHRSSVYVVPSKLIAGLVADSHRAWLSGKKKSGQTRKNTSMRAVHFDFTSVFGQNTEFGFGWLDKFNEAWHLIEPDNRKMSERDAA